METINVKTSSKQYSVFLGQGVIETLPEFINSQLPHITKILIIVDEKVAGLHLHTVKTIAAKTGKPVLEFIVPEGEHAKTFDVFYQCHSFALANHLNRKSLILALGGGAVGDLAGFVASTYMRGIPFIQLPTTLLAHDSAVGGKVAINHPEGKNMIGAFYQPEAVLYDLDFLRTLSEKELRSGFAEVIKHGIIQDADFYNWLRSEVKQIDAITDDQLQTIVKRGIEIKAAIVEEDEKETGIRAFLNFGHTLGHAVESSMGYGNFTHGESILIGMIYALKFSSKKHDLAFDVDGFTTWAESLGYETSVPMKLDPQTLLKKMKQDKKNSSDSVTFVLLDRVGSPLLTDLSDNELLDELHYMYNNK
jgi:3-dehydroquinate synthase